MQIVIDKESLIRLFTVAFYAICGGDYRDVKNTVMELLDKVGYTPLPKGHGVLKDTDGLLEMTKSYKSELGRLKVDPFVKSGIETVEGFIKEMPTIIEIDKAEITDH